LLKLKTTGLSESTIKKTDERLSYLGRNADQTKPEKAKVFITQMNQANSYKQRIVKAYNYLAVTNGVQ
jgi:hypothetical protein